MPNEKRSKENMFDLPIIRIESFRQPDFQFNWREDKRYSTADQPVWTATVYYQKKRLRSTICVGDVIEFEYQKSWCTFYLSKLPLEAKRKFAEELFVLTFTQYPRKEN